jgi:hypothetical protein
MASNCCYDTQVFGRSPRVFYFPDEMQEKFIDPRSKLGDMFLRVSSLNIEASVMLYIALMIFCFIFVKLGEKVYSDCWFDASCTFL